MSTIETGGPLIALLGIIPFFVGIIALIVQAARRGKKRVPVLILCFAPTMFIAGLTGFMVESYVGVFVVFAIYALIAYLCLRKKGNDTESESCFEVPAQPYVAPQDRPAPAPAPAARNEGVEELKKYKALLDMGAISEEEFNAKKKQILGL